MSLSLHVLVPGFDQLARQGLGSWRPRTAVCAKTAGGSRAFAAALAAPSRRPSDWDGADGGGVLAVGRPRCPMALFPRGGGCGVRVHGSRVYLLFFPSLPPSSALVDQRSSPGPSRAVRECRAGVLWAWLNSVSDSKGPPAGPAGLSLSAWGRGCRPAGPAGLILWHGVPGFDQLARWDLAFGRWALGVDQLTRRNSLCSKGRGGRPAVPAGLRLLVPGPGGTSWPGAHAALHCVCGSQVINEDAPFVFH